MRNLTNEPTVVSHEVRQAHSRALRKIHKWKSDYREMSNAIRATKQILRRFSEDRFAQITLRTLRVEANYLMSRHPLLKAELRYYSYPYASRELVELARRVG